jgi:hypothetical protein
MVITTEAESFVLVQAWTWRFQKLLIFFFFNSTFKCRHKDDEASWQLTFKLTEHVQKFL